MNDTPEPLSLEPFFQILPMETKTKAHRVILPSPDKSASRQ